MKYFIDLGAYNGDTLKKAVSLYSDFDSFIGFEPVGKLYKKAVSRFKNNPKVKIHRKAASVKYGSDKIVNSLKKKYGDTLPVSVGGNPHWEDISKSGLGGFFHKDTESIQCILDECDKWEKAMDWMKDSNNIFEDRGAYHPSLIGHRIFTEYIIGSLNL